MQLKSFALLLALLLCAASFAPCRAAGEEVAPEIPLDTALRFLVRPTLMGLVPPDDSEGYGEAFIRVLAVAKDSLTVRYEIKENIAPEERDTVNATRIRRGDITVAGISDGTGITPPLFWPDGDWETGDGLLWLPRAEFARLRQSGECNWSIGFNDSADSDAVRRLNEHIDSLREQAHLDEDDGIKLTRASEQANYPCWINGVRSELPAMTAVDSIGLAEYWILDDSGNPLVLKMSFIPPVIEDAQAALGLGLVETGAGYAVIEIDF